MKAFIFDVDDTLYDQVQPFELAYREMYPDEKEIEIRDLFAVSRKYSDEVFEASVKGTISMDEMYIYRIQKALEEFHVMITEEEALEFQHRYELCQQRIQPSAIMKKLLAECGKKAKLGIITNGPSEHQWDKVRALGVMSIIPRENVIVSGDFDVMKPDPGIFRPMEERLMLRPQDCCYIGDSVENDVIGAANAGWKSIWLNRRNKINHSGIPADYTVYTEQQLYDLIMEL